MRTYHHKSLHLIDYSEMLIIYRSCQFTDAFTAGDDAFVVVVHFSQTSGTMDEIRYMATNNVSVKQIYSGNDNAQGRSILI